MWVKAADGNLVNLAFVRAIEVSKEHEVRAVLGKQDIVVLAACASDGEARALVRKMWLSLRTSGQSVAG